LFDSDSQKMMRLQRLKKCPKPNPQLQDEQPGPYADLLEDKLPYDPAFGWAGRPGPLEDNRGQDRQSSGAPHMPLGKTNPKGTLTRDLRPLVFFHKSTPPRPLTHSLF
jgi:hypothetical protein